MLTKLVSVTRTRLKQLQQHLAVFGALALGSLAQAQDATTGGFNGSFSSNTNVSNGENAVGSAVAGSASNVVNLIFGPGFWIVLAIGALTILWGAAITKSKETIMWGFAIFLLAAVVKGIFYAVTGVL